MSKNLNNMPQIGFVSLGCPKALVDSEHILTQLRAEGYVSAASYESADLVIVNTCAFIEDAEKESLDAISEALAANGKVIVTGCLGAKKTSDGRDVIQEIHQQLLAITGPDSLDDVMRAVHEEVAPPHEAMHELLPPQGIKLTPPHYAYLKISEGCNHHCTFCIIPALRGRLVSHPIDALLQEAEILFQSGVKELLVISQDTGAYGIDTKFKSVTINGRTIRTHVTGLMTELGELAERYGAWVRAHYIYPYPHIDEIIPLMAQGKILPYLDVPLQHAHPDVLRRMRRPASGERNIERIQAWREICPDITIRSTVITGFPGETEEEFNALLEFVREAQIDRLGCFAYSPVDGAPANALPNPVPEAIREERRARLMQEQEIISKKRLQAKVGKTVRVLIDRVEANGTAVARSAADAPDIDGAVYLKRSKYDMRGKFTVGEFIDATVTAADAHDLWAET